MIEWRPEKTYQLLFNNIDIIILINTQYGLLEKIKILCYFLVLFTSSMGNVSFLHRHKPISYRFILVEIKSLLYSCNILVW